VLIPVGSLINGTTIKLNEARELTELEYFNIKLESHDVIYAEGAPVETLLEVDERAVNFSEYLRKYGAPKTDEVRSGLRHWSRARDDRIMAEYGLPTGPHSDYEVDHLIPLGLGGAGRRQEPLA
jgi:hypothetical protein